MIGLLWQVINKFVEKQEQTASHADDDSDDDDDDDDDSDADNDGDDDIEPSDHGNSENDVVKATSDTKSSAPVGVTSAAVRVTPRDETQQCVDGADYEWSVNISSTESEDNAAINGFSETFLITCDIVSARNISTLYTVSQKKRDTSFWTITPMCIVAFLHLLYKWKQEWICYRGVATFTTFPCLCLRPTLQNYNSIKQHIWKSIVTATFTTFPCLCLRPTI